MGLAASQGRLLLLTARKSDLELQAQTISQERLLLSIQQETLATEYSDAVNNQVWQIKPMGSTAYQVLSVAALNEHFNGDKFRVNQLGKGSSGNFRIVDTRTGELVDLSKLASADGDANSPDTILQQGLANGFYILETRDTVEDSPTNGEFIKMSLAGDSSFRQQYYTEDDAAAKAKYDAALNRVQRLDKQLELKLNQVETQHKAVETEIESVDKIISNNIEGSFKYFS